MAATRTRFDIAGPFILTVGDLHPRKNHIRLIRAFEELARAYPQIPHRLVIAGKDTWYADEVRGAARRSPAAGRIQFCGFVTDDDLVQLYNASDVFVFPSVYEGFGLPPLEAMACGRAVACSDATSLPEVVDSAAILFDPHQTREIVRALADLLLDAELRSRMERLALQRASRFSWNRTASQTLDVIHELHVEQRSRGRAIARP